MQVLSGHQPHQVVETYMLRPIMISVIRGMTGFLE